MSSTTKPIAIYYEHQHWFKPLFAELERRGISTVKIDAAHHYYDPTQLNGDAQFSLVFNRMSPSAYNRGNAHAIVYTLNYLEHLEQNGKRVVNGARAFRYEISKAAQLSLLESLGLPAPRARVFSHPSQAVAAAEGLRLPIVVKPNVGGSGTGVTRFDTVEALKTYADDGKINFGLDHTALVQEFIPARDNHIVRVEVVGGKYLYAIKVHLTGDTFDLCPADICRTTTGQELTRAACAVEAPKSGLKVEGYQPPADVISNVEKIMQTAGIEVGGVEYMIDDRDGKLLYYDINALSNFVADGKNVIGFDPFERLVDWLVSEAK